MQMMKRDTRDSAETLGFCRRRANSGTFQSTRIQRHIIPRLNPPPRPHSPPPPYLNKPLPMHTKRLVARRWVDFVLCLRAHMHAWLRRAVILMWFHLHARDPFVFIIITRPEETDLLGLVEMAMPLCLRIEKKNKTTLVPGRLSCQHNKGRRRLETLICKKKKRGRSSVFFKEVLRFWQMVLLMRLHKFRLIIKQFGRDRFPAPGPEDSCMLEVWHLFADYWPIERLIALSSIYRM